MQIPEPHSSDVTAIRRWMKKYAEEHGGEPDLLSWRTALRFSDAAARGTINVRLAWEAFDGLLRDLGLKS